MQIATRATTLTFSSLPAVGQPLEGGTFAGVITQDDGQHAAVVLLDEQTENLNWEAASAWAQKLEAQLPSRLAALSIFKHLKDRLKPRWHWTSETYVDEDEPEDASCAWCCDFSLGIQDFNHKSYEGCAVAVRSIPLTA